MITQTLHQNWTLDMPGMGKLPAAVPGSVYADLLAAGKLEDPFWRDNEDKALALMENDFLYTESFTPQQGILDCPHQVLRFEGVDTVADIRLNGVLLAHVENMHRTFEFDVAGIVKPGENWLEVKLYSPPGGFGRSTPKARPTAAATPCGASPTCARPTACSAGTGAPTCPTPAFGGRFPCWAWRAPGCPRCRSGSTTSTAG